MRSGRRSACCATKADPRCHRAVVRRDTDTGAIEGAHPFNPPWCRGQDAVQRQKGTPDRKACACGTVQGLSQEAPRQGQPTPWPPFVQIADQDCLSRHTAAQMLSDDPHLGDPRRLTQRQMRADHTERLAMTQGVDHHRAAMAMAGKVQQNRVLGVRGVGTLVAG